MDTNSTVQQSYLGGQHGAATVSTKAAGVVAQATQGLSAWTVLLSLLLAAVVYDQGTLAAEPVVTTFC